MHKDKLDKRKLLGNFRMLRTVENLIDFASNDYLGIAKSKKFKQEFLKEYEQFNKLGSTGSRLLTGNSSYVENLEQKIAKFHDQKTALIFNCGYMANIGLVNAIANEEDIFIYDSQIHASLHEGIRISKVKAFPFRHNDLDHLEKRLKNIPIKGNTYVCIESIYSTDGALAPLSEIHHLCQLYGARLIVDEAHAIGVFGPYGKGLVFKNGLTSKVFAQIVTFGKALGAFGAAVLGDQTLKETLINFAKSYIYTTSLPFPSLALIKCSYDLFPELKEERKHLHRLIQISNFTNSPIQPIPVKNNKAAHYLVCELAKKGFDLRAFLSPTVQRGKEMLRLTLHAFNTQEDLLSLLNVLRNYG